MTRIFPQQDMLEDLLNGLLDKTLTEADEARLARLLAESAEARVLYREWRELHAALHWDYARAAMQWPDTNSPDQAALLPPGPPAELGSADQWAFIGSPALTLRSLLFRASLAAAGLVTLAMTLLALLQLPRGHDARPPSRTASRVTEAIVEVASLGGAASWSDGGKMVSDLALGDRLGAGTISLEGESAFLTLRFDDGTAVTMAGEAMLEFASRGQKNIVLRHGTLSVDAQPQPPGRPMLIRTPTAEVEVVGTIFSVTADSSQTQLGVEEGSVRFRRLADGQVVEVPENHTATASLVTIKPMAASRPGEMLANYLQTFDGPPCLRCRGKWLPAENGLPSRARAVPYVANRNADGTPIVHYGVTVRDEDPGFVILHDDSVVAVRFRTATPQAVRVMIGMRRPGGAFGGNFEAKITTESAVRDDDVKDGTPHGWRRLEIPVRDFMPACPAYPNLTPGHAIGMLLVDTFSNEAQLEVAKVFVSRPAARADSE